MTELPERRPLASMSRLSRIIIRLLKWTILRLIAVLLLLGNGFEAKGQDQPLPQSAQTWSKVDYDPKLTDPFFNLNEWSDPMAQAWPKGTKPSPQKHTAKCFSDSFGCKHRVNFCEATLLDVNTICLFIHQRDGAFHDELSIQIENGWFRSRYSTTYLVSTRPHSHLMWTTKRQTLTLDRKRYYKGDVIKGRLEFECLQEATHPKYIEKWGRHLRTIEVYGVFRSIVK
ncbi:MAG: hypothetical protein V2B18_00425 [Pseudomonadota bacterium]